MKISKRCSKCQSAGIVRVPGQPWVGGNNIRWPWNTVQVTRYLCTSCGFVEQWIDSANDIARVKKKYGAAPG
jgi:hypothetical protein